MSAVSGTPDTAAGPRLLTDAELEVLDAVTRRWAQWTWRRLPEPDFAYAATLRITTDDISWQDRAELGSSLVREGWLLEPTVGGTFAGLAGDYTKADPRLIPDYSAENVEYDRRALWDCDNGSHPACPGWDVKVTIPMPGRPETRRADQRRFCPCPCGHRDAVRRIADGRGIAPGLTAEQTVTAITARKENPS